jgi:hypothetical protein
VLSDRCRMQAAPTRERGCGGPVLIQSVDFAQWLSREMDRRQWDRATLADRANLLPRDIQHVLDERGPASGRLCAGLAAALGAPVAQVAGRAGLVGSDGIAILARYAEDPDRLLGDLWLETVDLSDPERAAIVDCVVASRKLRYHSQRC